MSTKAKLKKPVNQPNPIAAVLRSFNPTTSRYTIEKPKRIGELPLDANSYASQSALQALGCLRRMTDGEGNFQDWNHLMFRLMVGVLADELYFKENADIVSILDQGIQTLHGIMVRTHCIGADGFGVKPMEHQALINALHLIDASIKFLYPNELVTATNEAGRWLDSVIQANQAMDPHYQMAQQLAQERQEVTHV